MPNLVHSSNCCLFIQDNKYTVQSDRNKCKCHYISYYLRKASRSHLLCALNPPIVEHILVYLISLYPLRNGICAPSLIFFSLTQHSILLLLTFFLLLLLLCPFSLLHILKFYPPFMMHTSSSQKIYFQVIPFYS